MNKQFSRPKKFGEILDVTFQISKKNFKDFLLIFLILIGPLLLLEAIILFASGTSFIRDVAAGSNWFEQMFNTFVEDEYYYEVGSTNLGSDIAFIVIGLFSIFLYPVAHGAILHGVNAIRNNEEFTYIELIKMSFRRFWPMVGSTILFGIILFLLLVAGIFVIFFFGASMIFINPIASIFLIFIFLLLLAIPFLYLLTRWGFYFGSTVIDEEAPGFSRSWGLTRGRTWPLIGLYVVFFLIITAISTAIEVTFGSFLGSSVLFSLILSVTNLITTMVFAVGYSVMYFDSKTRHDADDLKELIDNY